MKPEQQRIAIARAVGLEKFQPIVYGTRKGTLLPAGVSGVRLFYCAGGTNGWQDWEDVPDYLNDRNAMVEAMKTLTPRQREVFASDLNYQTNPVLGDQVYIGYIELPALDVFDLLVVDVPLLAKTFLRTLNLWVED